MATANEVKSHRFSVYCHSVKNSLEGKKYNSVNDIKKDAFVLYKDAGFSDDNAIVTYLDDRKVEVPLTFMLNKFPRDLFIRYVRIAFFKKWFKNIDHFCLASSYLRYVFKSIGSC